MTKDDEVKSKNDVLIRLPKERWFHITEEHSEMAGYYYEVLETIKDPEIIYEGKDEELIAIKTIEEGKFIVVMYKEIDKENGFVITAFLTRKKKQLEKRKKLWESQK
ncbi:MAG TPA: hypothetical protein VMV49_00280 [Candidatus Deferrimicrobium sp.]|nr:hypothetical protein [Candidatus Deferrimicrobium sp.]